MILIQIIDKESLYYLNESFIETSAKLIYVLEEIIQLFVIMKINVMLLLNQIINLIILFLMNVKFQVEELVFVLGI